MEAGQQTAVTVRLASASVDKRIQSAGSWLEQILSPRTMRFTFLTMSLNK